ncbi:MarR family transcriptional regulator [Microbacterium sp. 1P10UB]|uniref:MarR family winged helix-turn-helix transcriptional regulator n=1 Tax=unclassified Microbacterium TaxID=2609290 RepID=UPI00399FCAE2
MSSSTDADGETPTLRAALLAYGNARARNLGAARRALDIGEGDARAMLHIADHPGIRPSQLREFLDITAAGVTALLDRLERRDVVRRELDESDRRVTRVTLTVDMDETPWVALTRFDTRFDEATAALDASEVSRFAASLDLLTRATVGAPS